MRSYRLCTRFEETPHVGQLAEVDNGDARIRTPPAVASTESMSIPARCGRSTRRSQQFSGHQNDHLPHGPRPVRTTRGANVEPSRKVSQNQVSPVVHIGARKLTGGTFRPSFAFCRNREFDCDIRAPRDDQTGSQTIQRRCHFRGSGRRMLLCGNYMQRSRRFRLGCVCRADREQVQLESRSCRCLSAL
ncbi:hypothetical protein B0E55_06102 [Rhodococcus sp. 66b]|nr:hypothetical protein B0E55_06102 [Rhodococcus sp. 66b]